MNKGLAADIPQKRSLRLDSIDALRAIAAISVALYHTWGKDGIYPWPSVGIVMETFNPNFFHYLISPLRWGYLGVSLFLVLSGFCIHLAYAKKKHESGNYEFTPRPFFLRRIWRLYPAYLVALVGTFLLLNIGSIIPQLNLGAHLEIPSLRDLGLHLFMLHGFDEHAFYSVASVFWSLSLEFQLYLLYPLFLKLFERYGIRKAMIGLLGVSLIWRTFAVYVLGNGLISISTFGPFCAMGSVLARMPEWLMGAYLAHLFVTGKLQRAAIGRPIVLAAVLFIAGIASTYSRPTWILTDLIFGLAFTILSASFIAKESVFQSGKMLRRLGWLGTISYSVYLFHLQIFWLIAPFVDPIASLETRTIVRLVWLVITIFVCAQLFKFVEKPFLRLPKPGMRFHTAFSILQKSLGIKSDKEATVAISNTAE